MSETADTAAGDSPDHQVKQLIDTVCALTALIRMENRQLAGGAPASLAQTTEKMALAAELERRMAAVGRGELLLSKADPLLCLDLGAATAILQTAVEENVARVRGALTATQRRIDAIVRAMRRHQERGGYGPGGRVLQLVGRTPVCRNQLA